MQKIDTRRKSSDTEILLDPLTLLNVAQAQAVLCISRGTLYNLLRSGEISCIKIRSATRFQRSELNRFVSEKANPSSTQN